MRHEIDTNDKQRFPAAIARKVAEQLVTELAPRCERIEIAGSLRRGKADVGDIEILYVPRIGQVHVAGELFPKSGSLADELIEQWLTRGVLTKRSSINGTATWAPKTNWPYTSPLEYPSTCSRPLPNAGSSRWWCARARKR